MNEVNLQKYEYFDIAAGAENKCSERLAQGIKECFYWGVIVTIYVLNLICYFLLTMILWFIVEFARFSF